MQIDDLIILAENELNITLSPYYIYCTKNNIFKDLYKTYNFYFLDEEMVDFNVSPCAIGVTKKFRNDEILPQNNSLALLNQDEIIYFINTKKDDILYYDGINIKNTKQNLEQWINKFYEKH